MLYKPMTRANLRLPEGNASGRSHIPLVVVSEHYTEDVPKKNGQPGVYRNTLVDTFQLAPDGLTVYEATRVNVFYLEPREEVIEALDVDPETGEIMTEAPVIPAKVSYLYKRQTATQQARAANGGGTQPVQVAEAADEVTA